MSDAKPNPSTSAEDKGSPKRSRIKRLIIEELFGPGSGTIDIEFKLEDRVTILHGRNGSGKSITLELIESLARGDASLLFDYPFGCIFIELVDGTWEEYRRDSDRATIFYRGSDGNRDCSGEIFTLNASFGRTLTREQTQASGQGRGRNSAQVEDRQWSLFGSAQPGDIHREGRFLHDFSIHAPRVKVVRNNRLVVGDDAEEVDRPHRGTRSGGPRASESSSVVNKASLMVDRIGRDVRLLVSKADEEYRQISTRLDGSLAKRLFEPVSTVPDSAALKARSEALQLRERELQSLGLLGEVNEPVDESLLNASNLATFNTVLSDREDKLVPFEALRSKSHRLLENLNRKLAPKTIRLDVERGYEAVTASGTALPLSKLSSGEQHQLVLMHELLFDVEPGTLILIDEPELSLHPEWQVQVLGDLLEIAKLSDLDILVATHSPYIAGDRVDLMVGVGVPNP